VSHLGPSSLQEKASDPDGPRRGAGYRLQATVALELTLELGDRVLQGRSDLLSMRGGLLAVPGLHRRGEAGRLILHLPEGDVHVWGNLPARRERLWLAQFVAIPSGDRERLYHFLAGASGIRARVRAPRVPLSMRVLTRYGGKLWVCQSLDLSASGILLESPAPLEVGASCRLRLELDERTFWAEALVARAEGPLIGLMFEGMDPADQGALNRFLEDAAKALTPIPPGPGPVSEDPTP